MHWKTLLCCCVAVPIEVHAASGTASEPGVLALFAVAFAYGVFAPQMQHLGM